MKKKTILKKISPFSKETMNALGSDYNEIKRGRDWIKDEYKYLYKEFFNAKKNTQKIDYQSLFQNFDSLLECWGIKPHEIRNVIKALYVRAFGYLFLNGLGIYLVLQDRDSQFYSGIIILILGIVGFLTSLWRAIVLKKRRYINFFHWILGYKI